MLALKDTKQRSADFTSLSEKQREDRSIAPQTKTNTSLFLQRNMGNSYLQSSGGLMIQRKCACGSQIIAGGECEECAKSSDGLQRKLAIGASNDPLEQEADRVADQVMAAPLNSTVNAAPPHIQRSTGQANEGLDSAPASVDRVLASPGRPLESALRQDMEQRFGHDFSRVRVHTDSAAEQSARDLNANAYTVGNNVVFGTGGFAPGSHEGRRLLAHELTHVVQQSPNLDSSGASPSSILARKPKVLDKDDVVVSMRVVKNAPGSKFPSTVQITTSKGQTYSYVATQDNVPVGIYSGKKLGSGLQIGLEKSGLVLYFVGNSNSPSPASLSFSKEFQIEVVDAPSKVPELGGGGKGEGSGNKIDGKPSSNDGDGKISDIPKATGKKWEDKTGSKDGVKNGSKDGIKTGNKDGGNQPIPDAVTEVPQDFKGPVIQVSDIKQVEALKAKGLLPAKTADEIKAKLEKKEELSFDEAQALIDGLLTVSEPPEKDKQGKESWLKWARFVQANKEKISGKSKSGDKGLTVAEVNDILTKYKEFVGVKDAPIAKEGAGVPKDLNPDKRKGWNNLQPWEKDMWKEYLKKYPSDFATDDSSDFHIDDGMKLTMALRISPNYVKGGGREALIQMVNDPIFIGGTIVGIGLYVAAWLAPEPLFTKATAATITTALLTLFTVSEIKNFAVAWMDLSDESAKAKSIADLEVAAEHFGKAMGGILVRVLVTIATLIAGKLLPGPPAAVEGPPSSGGGTSMGAVAGGPKGLTMPIPDAVPVNGIKVMADGTIVIVTNLGVMAMAAKGGGGGSNGSQGKNAPNAPENKSSSEQVKVKEPEIPEDTHGLRDTPGGKPVSEGKEVGNWVHSKVKNFEKLKKLIPNKPNIVSEDIPPDAIPEYPVRRQGYTPGREPKIDRLHRAGETVIEIKPHGLYEQGLAEAKVYAQDLDITEPLPDGRKWQAKCVTYDYDLVSEFLKHIGYLP